MLLLPILIVALTLSNFVWQQATNKDWGKAWERSFAQGIALCLYFMINLAIQGNLFHEPSNAIAYSAVSVTGDESKLVKDLVENRLREEGVKIGVTDKPELVISSYIGYRPDGKTTEKVGLIVTSPSNLTAVGYGEYDHNFENSTIRLATEATYNLVDELKHKMSKVEEARLKYERARREFQDADPNLEKDIGKTAVK